MPQKMHVETFIFETFLAHENFCAYDFEVVPGLRNEIRLSMIKCFPGFRVFLQTFSKSKCFPNFWCSRIFLLLSSVLSSSFILQKSCSETEKATMAKVYVKKIKSLHFLLKVQICTLNKQIFGLLQ
jgi:hypothetical protein